MTKTEIKSALKRVDNAKDIYEVFEILATDETIDKNHALQWYAGYSLKQFKN